MARLSEWPIVATTVVITGTGCPVPSADRAGPGVLVTVGDLALQFDVGRSTVQRLAGAGLWPTDLDAVFLTHHKFWHRYYTLQDMMAILGGAGMYVAEVYGSIDGSDFTGRERDITVVARKLPHGSGEAAASRH